MDYKLWTLHQALCQIKSIIIMYCKCVLTYVLSFSAMLHKVVMFSLNWCVTWLVWSHHMYRKGFSWLMWMGISVTGNALHPVELLLYPPYLMAIEATTHSYPWTQFSCFCMHHVKCPRRSTQARDWTKCPVARINVNKCLFASCCINKMQFLFHYLLSNKGNSTTPCISGTHF